MIKFLSRKRKETLYVATNILIRKNEVYYSKVFKFLVDD